MFNFVEFMVLSFDSFRVVRVAYFMLELALLILHPTELHTLLYKNKENSWILGRAVRDLGKLGTIFVKARSKVICVLVLVLCNIYSIEYLEGEEMSFLIERNGTSARNNVASLNMPISFSHWWFSLSSSSLNASVLGCLISLIVG